MGLADGVLWVLVIIMEMLRGSTGGRCSSFLVSEVYEAMEWIFITWKIEE